MIVSYRLRSWLIHSHLTISRSCISHSTLSRSLLISAIICSLLISCSLVSSSTASWRQFSRTLGAILKTQSIYQSLRVNTSATHSTSQPSRRLSRQSARPPTMCTVTSVPFWDARSVSFVWVSAQAKASPYQTVWSRSSTRPRSRTMTIVRNTRIWDHWTLKWNANRQRCYSSRLISTTTKLETATKKLKSKKR